MEYLNLKNENIIYKKKNIKNNYYINSKIKDELTIIILAAGKGSRLNIKKNKFLFNYKKNENILENYEKKLNQFKYFIFVVHISDKEIVREIKKKFNKQHINFIYQYKRDGMASALYLCKNKISTSNFMLMWCDQPYIKKNSIIALSKLHFNKKSVFSLITCIRQNSYISIIRKKKAISKVIISSEINAKISGETDSGLFIFHTNKIYKLLSKYIDNKIIIGKKTKEKNLLPLFPIISKKYGSLTLRVENSKETLGINYKNDAIN